MKESIGMGMGAQILLLGVRGTVPVCGEAFIRYGGATSCVLVRMGGQSILLDAGSGLMSLGFHLQPEEKRLTLLLSHAHIDHLLGLPVCAPILEKRCSVRLYAAPQQGHTARQQVEALMKEPLWPTGPEVFGGQLQCFDLKPEGLQLGSVVVRLLRGNHPGGCTAFRLEHNEQSIVFATDYELGGQAEARLSAFAKECSLLLCDAQYTDAEYLSKKGFGHSGMHAAVRLAQSCGAQQVRMIHHDPCRTDEQLDALQIWLNKLLPNASFGRSGEEIWI